MEGTLCFSCIKGDLAYNWLASAAAPLQTPAQQFAHMECRICTWLWLLAPIASSFVSYPHSVRRAEVSSVF